MFWVTGVLEMTATENTIRFSGHTLDKATKAKVTLENYYSNLIAQHVERKQRYSSNSRHRIVSKCQLLKFVVLEEWCLLGCYAVWLL
jgi:hypothetical protein